MRRVCFVLGLVLIGCKRPHAAPSRPDATVMDVAREVGGADVAPDRGRPVPDVAPLVPTRPAVAGPWRSLPRLALSEEATLAAWDAPPDLDGDGLEDAVRAVRWDPLVARCVSAPRDCPSYDDAEHQEHPITTLALALSLSGDHTDADAGRTWRLAGVRRIGPLPEAPTRSRWTGVTFAEFGPAVMTVSSVESSDGSVSDIADIVDLYVGVGLERHVGTVIHHCTREPGHAPTRSGTLSVAMPAWAPLVWRAAMAHPFSSCEAPSELFDQSLARPLTQGISVTVASREPVAADGRVTVVRAGDGFAAVDARPRHREDAPWPEDLSVFTMTHGCSTDRLEYRGADRHRCRLELRRDDGPLPGCLDGASTLDPTGPVPVALVGGGDAGALELVFARAGALLSATLPPDCRTAHHHLDALSASGPLAPGSSASPDARSVITASGMDVWLWEQGRRLPVLLNPPGGVLPRGTLRAIYRIDATHAAAVLSRELLVFSWAQSSVVDEVPDEAPVTEAEFLRALRGVQ